MESLVFGQMMLVFEALPAGQTHMRSLIGVLVLVPLQRAELGEAFLAFVARKVFHGGRGGLARLGATCRVRTSRWQIEESLIGQQVIHIDRQATCCLLFQSFFSFVFIRTEIERI